MGRSLSVSPKSWIFCVLPVLSIGSSRAWIAEFPQAFTQGWLSHCCLCTIRSVTASVTASVSDSDYDSSRFFQSCAGTSRTARRSWIHRPTHSAQPTAISRFTEGVPDGSGVSGSASAPASFKAWELDSLHLVISRCFCHSLDWMFTDIRAILGHSGTSSFCDAFCVVRQASQERQSISLGMKFSTQLPGRCCICIFETWRRWRFSCRNSNSTADLAGTQELDTFPAGLFGKHQPMWILDFLMKNGPCRQSVSRQVSLTEIIIIMNHAKIACLPFVADCCRYTQRKPWHWGEVDMDRPADWLKWARQTSKGDEFISHLQVASLLSRYIEEGRSKPQARFIAMQCITLNGFGW